MNNLQSIINAAGKLTALGGSAQSDASANAQALAARQHVDLTELRRHAGSAIAKHAGAEAACITSGAAAGISISIAATLTGTNLDLIHQLPASDQVGNRVLLQAGHAINFGAPVEQMIRLGGGEPRLLGSANNCAEKILRDTLEREEFAAMVYVQSHHCVQTGQIGLNRCLELCHAKAVPVIVDAAAEEDLRSYLRLGADLVIYSGGKAFCGPTSGFIVGRADLIEACEMQNLGIARTMKVGKETIAGLLVAMEEYVGADQEQRLQAYARCNELLLKTVASCQNFSARLQQDEAGRGFARVAIGLNDDRLDIRDLVIMLRDGSPSIRTRNHHLDEGYLLLDPREVNQDQINIIATRLVSLDEQIAETGKSR